MVCNVPMSLLNGAVLRHEWRVLWLNPATLLFLSFGWVVEGFLAFYAAPLLHLRAAPGPLVYVPMIFCLLLPLLVMPMADDERSNRLERMLTLPIAPDAVWFTRFVLYWLVAGLFLAGTFTLSATVAAMGAADWSLIVKGYLATWLVGGIQLALAFWLAAEMGQAVVAFLCGFLVNVVFVAAGWYYIFPWLKLFGPVPVPYGLPGDMVAIVNMFLAPILSGIIYLIWRQRRKARARG
jgi:hypothetical protein